MVYTNKGDFFFFTREKFETEENQGVLCILLARAVGVSVYLTTPGLTGEIVH